MTTPLECPEFMNTWVTSGRWLDPTRQPIPQEVLTAPRRSAPGGAVLEVRLPGEFAGSELVRAALLAETRESLTAAVHRPLAAELDRPDFDVVSRADAIGLPVDLPARSAAATNLSGATAGRVTHLDEHGGLVTDVARATFVRVHPAAHLADAHAASDSPVDKVFGPVRPVYSDAGLRLLHESDTAHQSHADAFVVGGDYKLSMEGAEGELVAGGHTYDPAVVAGLIRSDPHWNGRPITIVACEAGLWFARGLARELAAVPVRAAMGVVRTTDRGHVVVDDPSVIGAPWVTYQADDNGDVQATFHQQAHAPDGLAPTAAEIAAADTTWRIGLETEVAIQIGSPDNQFTLEEGEVLAWSPELIFKVDSQHRTINGRTGRVWIIEIVSRPARVTEHENALSLSAVRSARSRALRGLLTIPEGRYVSLGDALGNVPGIEFSVSGSGNSAADSVMVLGGEFAAPYTQWTAGLKSYSLYNWVQFALNNFDHTGSQDLRDLAREGLAIGDRVAADFLEYTRARGLPWHARQIAGHLAFLYPHLGTNIKRFIYNHTRTPALIAKHFLLLATRKNFADMHADLPDRAQVFLRQRAQSIKNMMNEYFIRYDNIDIVVDGLPEVYDSSTGGANFFHNAYFGRAADNILYGYRYLDGSPVPFYDVGDEFGINLTRDGVDAHDVVGGEFRYLHTSRSGLPDIDRQTEEIADMTAAYENPPRIRERELDAINRAVDQVDREIGDTHDNIAGRLQHQQQTQSSLRRLLERASTNLWQAQDNLSYARDAMLAARDGLPPSNRFRDHTLTILQGARQRVASAENLVDRIERALQGSTQYNQYVGVTFVDFAPTNTTGQAAAAVTDLDPAAVQQSPRPRLADTDDNNLSQRPALLRPDLDSDSRRELVDELRKIATIPITGWLQQLRSHAERDTVDAATLHEIDTASAMWENFAASAEKTIPGIVQDTVLVYQQAYAAITRLAQKQHAHPDRLHNQHPLPAINEFVSARHNLWQQAETPPFSHHPTALPGDVLVNMVRSIPTPPVRFDDLVPKEPDGLHAMLSALTVTGRYGVGRSLRARLTRAATAGDTAAGDALGVLDQLARQVDLVRSRLGTMTPDGLSAVRAEFHDLLLLVDQAYRKGSAVLGESAPDMTVLTGDTHSDARMAAAELRAAGLPWRAVLRIAASGVVDQAAVGRVARDLGLDEPGERRLVELSEVLGGVPVVLSPPAYAVARDLGLHPEQVVAAVGDVLARVAGDSVVVDPSGGAWVDRLVEALAGEGVRNRIDLTDVVRLASGLGLDAGERAELHRLRGDGVPLALLAELPAELALESIRTSRGRIVTTSAQWARALGLAVPASLVAAAEVLGVEPFDVFFVVSRWPGLVAGLRVEVVDPQLLGEARVSAVRRQGQAYGTAVRDRLVAHGFDGPLIAEWMKHSARLGFFVQNLGELFGSRDPEANRYPLRLVAAALPEVRPETVIDQLFDLPDVPVPAVVEAGWVRRMEHLEHRFAQVGVTADRVGLGDGGAARLVDLAERTGVPLVAEEVLRTAYLAGGVDPADVAGLAVGLGVDVSLLRPLVPLLGRVTSLDERPSTDELVTELRRFLNVDGDDQTLEALLWVGARGNGPDGLLLSELRHLGERILDLAPDYLRSDPFTRVNERASSIRKAASAMRGALPTDHPVPGILDAVEGVADSARDVVLEILAADRAEAARRAGTLALEVHRLADPDSDRADTVKDRLDSDDLPVVSTEGLEIALAIDALRLAGDGVVRATESLDRPLRILAREIVEQLSETAGELAYLLAAQFRSTDGATAAEWASFIDAELQPDEGGDWPFHRSTTGDPDMLLADAYWAERLDVEAEEIEAALAGSVDLELVELLGLSRRTGVSTDTLIDRLLEDGSWLVGFADAVTEATREFGDAVVDAEALRNIELVAYRLNIRPARLMRMTRSVWGSSGEVFAQGTERFREYVVRQLQKMSERFPVETPLRGAFMSDFRLTLGDLDAPRRMERAIRHWYAGVLGLGGRDTDIVFGGGWFRLGSWLDVLEDLRQERQERDPAGGWEVENILRLGVSLGDLSQEWVTAFSLHVGRVPRPGEVERIAQEWEVVEPVRLLMVSSLLHTDPRDLSRAWQGEAEELRGRLSVLNTEADRFTAVTSVAAALRRAGWRALDYPGAPALLARVSVNAERVLTDLPERAHAAGRTQIDLLFAAKRAFELPTSVPPHLVIKRESQQKALGDPRLFEAYVRSTAPPGDVESKVYRDSAWMSPQQLARHAVDWANGLWRRYRIRPEQIWRLYDVSMASGETLALLKEPTPAVRDTLDDWRSAAFPDHFKQRIDRILVRSSNDVDLLKNVREFGDRVAAVGQSTLPRLDLPEFRGDATVSVVLQVVEDEAATAELFLVGRQDDVDMTETNVDGSRVLRLDLRLDGEAPNWLLLEELLSAAAGRGLSVNRVDVSAGESRIRVDDLVDADGTARQLLLLALTDDDPVRRLAVLGWSKTEDPEQLLRRTPETAGTTVEDFELFPKGQLRALAMLSAASVRRAAAVAARVEGAAPADDTASVGTDTTMAAPASPALLAEPEDEPSHTTDIVPVPDALSRPVGGALATGPDALAIAVLAAAAGQNVPLPVSDPPGLWRHVAARIRDSVVAPPAMRTSTEEAIAYLLDVGARAAVERAWDLWNPDEPLSLLDILDQSDLQFVAYDLENEGHHTAAALVSQVAEGLSVAHTYGAMLADEDLRVALPRGTLAEAVAYALAVTVVVVDPGEPDGMGFGPEGTPRLFIEGRDGAYGAYVPAGPVVAVARTVPVAAPPVIEATRDPIEMARVAAGIQGVGRTLTTRLAQHPDTLDLAEHLRTSAARLQGALLGEGNLPPAVIVDMYQNLLLTLDQTLGAVRERVPDMAAVLPTVAGLVDLATATDPGQSAAPEPSWDLRRADTVTEHGRLYVVSSHGPEPERLVNGLAASLPPGEVVILLGVGRGLNLVDQDIKTVNELMEQFAQRGRLPIVVTRGRHDHLVQRLTPYGAAILHPPAKPDTGGLTMHLDNLWAATATHPANQSLASAQTWRTLDQATLRAVAALGRPTAAVKRIDDRLGTLIWAPDLRSQSHRHSVRDSLRGWNPDQMWYHLTEVQDMIGRVPDQPSVATLEPVLELATAGHAHVLADYFNADDANRTEALLSVTAELHRAEQLDRDGLTTGKLAGVVAAVGIDDFTPSLVRIIGAIASGALTDVQAADKFITDNRHKLTPEQKSEAVEAISTLHTTEHEPMAAHKEALEKLAAAVLRCP
ncbi:hypothetical protein MRQ36_01845 [Micromonospora sp. R77]|uniref:hypothetical protein n=1 Tax=Micromonospora sp. R77 TaxID=2925836 RepID=UPI001F60F239|nr:hypothetical protein [Micromonospora sp. R77]MCI4061383.1 hypothetical protein [Micromonospora sp. R77]